jgi:predicted O-linked N-acetylglucosamine transferase (SPINDLY family)
MSTADEDTFNQKFTAILQNPQSITDPQKQQFYDLGMQLVRQTPEDEPDAREAVLQKLMIILPRHSELMYFMGCIWRNHNFFKALSWYQLCFTVNPQNIENILDLTKLLFDSKYYKYIRHINDTHQNILNSSKDPRVLLLVGTLLIQEKYFTAAERVFGNIFGLIKQGQSTAIDSGFMAIIYSNMAFILQQKLQIDKAHQYLHKSLSFATSGSGGNSQTKDIRTIFHSLMLIYDYQYSSSNDRMMICKQYTEALYTPPPEQIFPPRQIVSGKRLRIGYVSSGFHLDVIACFITPIIKHHTPTDFEVYVFTQRYYNEVAAKYRPWSGHVHVYDIQHLSDYDVAAFVRHQQVDILVDLQGYTEVSRLGIFALRPAPVQITYLGFPNSLGLSCIPYRITDSVADNMHSTQVYSEQRLYMPRCFLLYSNDHLNIERNNRNNTGGSQIVFGALNRESKTSSACMECWRKILAANPQSRIVIKLDGIDTLDDKINYYMDALHLEDRNRMTLIPYSNDNAEYARIFAGIDIFLDTFPYSGTTTTCNALYAGVPVITLYNINYHAHNVSASLLAHSGFSELVAYTDAEYVSKATELARNTSVLQSYKSRIRDGFTKLMNPVEFMAGYEGILKQVVLANQKEYMEQQIDSDED